MAGNNLVPWPFTNKPLGAPRAAAYYFDADDYLDNTIAGSDIAGMRYIRGVNCVDKASVAGQCEIWLESHPGGGTGKRTVADVNTYAFIQYAGTHSWLVQVQHGGAGTECFIVFSDAIGLRKGVAPTGLVYNNAAFIDALDIFIFADDTQFEFPVDFLLLSNTDPGGINGDVIPRGVVAPAGSIEEGLTDIEVAFDVEHALATGAHAPEIIENDNLNIDVFRPALNTGESPENLIDGDMEYDDNGDGVANGWLPYNAPTTVDLSTLQVFRGNYSQRVVAGAPGMGIEGRVDTRLHRINLPSDFDNKTLSFALVLYTDTNDSVDIELDDGVAAPVATTVGVAGSFQPYHISLNFSAGAADAVARIYANQACTFYVAWTYIYLGRLNRDYSNSPAGVCHRLFRQSDYQNAFPNGDCKDWTNLWGGAAGAIMDGWVVTAGAPVIAQNAVTFLYGQYSLDVTTGIGDAIQISTLNPLDFVNPAGMERQTCCASFYYYGVAGNPVLQVTVGDGVVNTNYTIYPTVGVWQRFIAFMEPQAAAVTQFVTIVEMNIPGGNFLIDGVMFHRGLMPQAFQPSAGLQPYKWDFVHAGAIPGFPQNMTFHGSLLEAQAPSDMYVHKLMVRNAVAPGGVIVDTYDVLQNGAAVGITATVTGAALVGGTHVPGGFFYNQGDRIQVLMTPGGGATTDIIATVGAIKIGS